jgi:hypothetical protein
VEPLEITATLAAPLAVPIFPVALDGLLAAVVCERLGLIAGVGEWQNVEVPLQRSACGRYHMASVAHYEVHSNLLGYVIKRPPVVEYMQIGSEKIKSVNTGTGRNKAFRIPQPRALIDCMRWWCIGDRDAGPEPRRGGQSGQGGLLGWSLQVPQNGTPGEGGRRSRT